MENKKAQIEKMIILLIALLMIAFLLFIACKYIITDDDYNDFCKSKYGEEFIYESYAKDYPMNIDTCVSVSEDGNLTTYYFIYTEIENYCNKSRFWSLYEC